MLIRALSKNDVSEILGVYKRAFVGYPWYEDLSAEELWRRWNSHSSKRGFDGLVGIKDNRMVGAVWWNLLAHEDLEEFKKGEDLKRFVKNNFPQGVVFWEREIITDPSYQNKGIAQKLRQEFVSKLDSFRPAVILTRMRGDNSAILRIAEKLGFRPAGIRVPSSQKEAVFHEYWYLFLGK